MNINITITGYYKKENLGDDLFEKIAEKFFIDTKNIKYNIVSIDKLNFPQNRHYIDRIILFGGETLNNYFLDKLIEMKKYNPNVKYVAIGVSSNQTYNEILNKMNIFEYILFRSKKDYDFFKDYFDCDYAPDMVFNIKKENSIIKKEKIGFFLSQTVIAHMDKESENQYINKFISFIKFIIDKGYHIYLFAMCTNNKNSEDDNFINSKIYSKLIEDDKKYIKVYTSNDKVLEKIKKIRFSICWRFHSHVLSIINNIPFISISNTPKVKDLLDVSDLNDLSCDISCDVSELINKFNYIIQNETKLKRKINKIYKINHQKVKKYFDLNIYLNNKKENVFYIEPDYYQKIYNHIVENFNKYKTSDNNWFNTQIITFFFTRKLENDYNYGLSEKIDIGVENLKNDIYWLINDSILQRNLYFYENIIETFNLKEIRKGNINIRFINQSDYKGLHRSGWQYVVDELDKYQSSNSLLCDLYLDRTFHWNFREYSKLGIIPYKKNWIGFIHHTCNEDYTSYNTVNLFKNKLFIQSLKYCKGIFVLSEYLKFQIEKILYKMNLFIKVFSLIHPTQFVANTFDIKKFNRNNEKKIIQIGAWMRNINAINVLQINDLLIKSVLIGKKMENYYNKSDSETESETELDLDESISRDNINRKIDINNSVKILTFLDNEKFDELLSENIVFLNLIDASAVNTLIECIVRNTPIVINKLPAVVEILGSDYPLFYDKLEDINDILSSRNIESAYIYLKRLDKTNLKIETFINKFFDIVKKIEN